MWVSQKYTIPFGQLLKQVLIPFELLSALTSAILILSFSQPGQVGEHTMNIVVYSGNCRIRLLA